MSDILPERGVRRIDPPATAEQLDQLVQLVLSKIWEAGLEPEMEVIEEYEGDDGVWRDRVIPVYRFTLDGLALHLSSTFEGWDEGSGEFCGPIYSREDGEELAPATLCFNLKAEDISVDECVTRELDIYIACDQDEGCCSQVSASWYSDVGRTPPDALMNPLEADDQLRFTEMSALGKLVDASL